MADLEDFAKKPGFEGRAVPATQRASFGLTSAEAARAIRTYGPNELPSARPLRWTKVLLQVLKEPMLALLLTCAGIYLLVGEPADGFLLLGSVAVVFAISFFQEHKAENALQSLRDLSSPQAQVIRDGTEKKIPARDLVPGDVVLVREGDRVPADLRLLSGTNLQADESLLTGEAYAVRKETPEEPLWSGTLIVSGKGSATVAATGIQSRIGKIGTSLQGERSTRTHLQLEIATLVRRFAFFGVGISVLITVAYGLQRGNWPEAFLSGIAAAIALLPEEFPVVLTVFLALGAWRIAQKKVLTRKLSAIEALGTITHLCVDKTGTLTENRMELRALHARGETKTLSSPGIRDLSSATEEVLRYGALATPPSPFDPMEKAILSRAATQGVDLKDHALLREYPLTSQLFAMSIAWRTYDGRIIAAAKGAPEAIAELCRVKPEQVRDIVNSAREFATQGLRVLGVARARGIPDFTPASQLPASQRAFTFEFLGLIGFEDPLRDGVRDSVQKCRGAGIEVLMLTGDYPETARSIARQIDLGDSRSVMTGPELREMSDLELKSALARSRIFARVIPEQKLRLISALREKSAVVAMTGDGVNDAPALKWSDVGIAMGSRGTDVAREAADLVLMNDDFTSIVDAIELGRRVFENIHKALSFVLAVHVPIAGLAAIPVLVGTPLILYPAHIVFLQLIIDPACALVFESEPADPKLMRLRPRKSGEELFSIPHLLRLFRQGGVVLMITLAVYGGALRLGIDSETTRTLTFISLVIANLGLILVYRSGGAGIRHTLHVRNRAFAWILLAELVLLTLLLSVPALRELFRFELPPLAWIGGAIAVGLLPIPVLGIFVNRDWNQPQIASN